MGSGWIDDVEDVAQRYRVGFPEPLGQLANAPDCWIVYYLRNLADGAKTPLRCCFCGARDEKVDGKEWGYREVIVNNAMLYRVNCEVRNDE